MANRVYTAYWETLIAAAGQLQENFDLVSNLREIKVKSLTWTFQIFDNVTTKVVPWRNAPDHQYNLLMDKPGMGQPFTFVSGSGFQANGNFIYLFEPGNYVFDALFFKNSISCQLNYRNRSANACYFASTVTIVTEENVEYT